MTTETRFALIAPNGDVLRFQAHKDKTELVVAKFTNPETLDNLIADVAIDPGIQDSWQGSKYKIVSMQREGAAKLIAAIFTKHAVPLPPPAPKEGLAAYDGEDSDD